jgi:hypothetical protein
MIMGLFRWGAGDRFIYRYWDGTFTPFGFRRIRSIDPFAAYLATLKTDQFSWDVTMQMATAEVIGDAKDRKQITVMKLEAVAAAAKCCRQVFGVKPLADGGLTDQECFWLLADFEAFVFSVKKNGSRPQTSLPAESSREEPQRNDSGSGSTETVSEPSEASGPPTESPGDSAARSE